MTREQSVGFIGLGIMGGAMVRRVMAAGHAVHVHARNRDRAAPFLQEGALWADGAAALARSCATIFTIVGGPKDVAELYLGEDGLVANAAPGDCLVDMTTSAPDLARRIALVRRGADRHQFAGTGGQALKVGGRGLRTREELLSQSGQPRQGFCAGGDRVQHPLPLNPHLWVRLCGQQGLKTLPLLVDLRRIRRLQCAVHQGDPARQFAQRRHDGAGFPVHLGDLCPQTGVRRPVGQPMDLTGCSARPLHELALRGVRGGLGQAIALLPVVLGAPPHGSHCHLASQHRSTDGQPDGHRDRAEGGCHDGPPETPAHPCDQPSPGILEFIADGHGSKSAARPDQKLDRTLVITFSILAGSVAS